jgi:deoxyribonuclease (pyrimidine dimer)
LCKENARFAAKNGDWAKLLSEIPGNFTLGAGHVKFFYDKGNFLSKRFDSLKIELLQRNFDIDPYQRFDPEGYMRNSYCFFDYDPTPEALELIRKRISEKVALKPNWYRKTEV